MSYERVGGTLMTNKENNFPKRRFKNFELSGPWEARFLGELGKINPKGQLPQTFEYVDLESVVGIEMVSHRKVTRDTAPSRAQRLAQSGDLFYQTVRPYQKNNFLATNLNGDYVFSTGYAQLRPIISGYFLLSLVQNDSFVKSVLSRCTGTSYPSISADELSKIQVLVSNDEQELYAIGKLFQKLDRLIILHQHKLDKLKNLKKAYLSEMFPAEGERVPKRRFPGFEGEWEQKRLGEVVEFKRGLTYNPSSISKTGIRVLRSSNIEEDYFVMREDDVFVDESHISIPFVEKGDILITSANGSSRLVGKHAIIDSDEKMVHGGFMLLAKTKQYNFINALFSSNWYRRFIERTVLGGNGAIGNLSKSYLEKEEPYFPTHEEQEKIGEFFQKLDKSISIQQQKLDKLNDLKKAYLNELFV